MSGSILIISEKFCAERSCHIQPFEQVRRKQNDCDHQPESNLDRRVCENQLTEHDCLYFHTPLVGFHIELTTVLGLRQNGNLTLKIHLFSVLQDNLYICPRITPPPPPPIQGSPPPPTHTHIQGSPPLSPRSKDHHPPPPPDPRIK